MSGIELNRNFYNSVVAPIVAPWRHSAALIGYGSQVLGYDDQRSTDHGWGLRCNVFVAADDVSLVRAAIEEGLPERFAGWPVQYAWDNWPLRHHVDVWELDAWLRVQLGHDTSAMSSVDWLVTPQQQLLEVTRGAVYHDGLGCLEPLRRRLSSFPDDVWRWILACQWKRITQEEAFVGRAAEVGDDVGAHVVAMRLVRELMRLHFVYAHEYWPYTKWFGTAYAHLPGSNALLPHFRAVAAGDHSALASVYEAVATMHNDAGLTPPLESSVRNFHSRPFLVIGGDRFYEAVMKTVGDPELRALAPIGSIDQFVDSTDVTSSPDRATRLRAMYASPGAP